MIRKITLSLFACMAGLIFISAVNYTTGGHPSSTGAPGEQTCGRPGCHSDASITNNSPVNTFTFSDPANTYKTDGVYTLSVEINLANINKFGFQIVAIDSASQKNAGTWIITESARTQVITGEAPFTTRKYITHTVTGTSPIATGKNKWNFKWKAPASNLGTIQFYYVTNATNKNDMATGDKLFLSSHKIRFSPNSVSVKVPKIASPGLTINGQSVSVFAGQHTIQSLTIYDLNGKLVYQSRAVKNGDTINHDELHKSGTSVLVYHLLTDQGNYQGKVRM